jgi:hypothetical protein
MQDRSGLVSPRRAAILAPSPFPEKTVEGYWRFGLAGIARFGGTCSLTAAWQSTTHCLYTIMRVFAQ